MIVQSDPRGVHWVGASTQGRATLPQSRDPTRGVDWVQSSPSGCALIETGSFGQTFQTINDEQLLALAGGAPVALVRDSPGEARLFLLADGREAGSGP
jgi:hypothetical protein